jgi:hypothetical protein
MPLTCPSCGASPDPRDVFCGTCGHPVRNHAAQAAGSAASANGRAQWPGWGTSRTSYAASADEPDQRTNPQRPVREYRQVSRDVPEPRGTHDGRPAEAFAAADGSTRMRVTIPRDQAESGVAAADPQSYITADDRRIGYAALGVSGTLDPLSNTRFFWQLARRFALYYVVSNVIGFTLFLLAFLATYADGGITAVANGRGAFTTVAFINLLITATLMAMFLFKPVPALLGQWSRMLTYQAPAAGSALDYARQALDRHATPHDTLGLRALSPPGEGRREYLELRCGYFAGYISCFPHGRDLYVGWTFWIYISPARLFLARLGRRIQDYTGRGNDMYQTLRYESARATIASLHTCTLEGVDAATGGTPPPNRSE